MLNPPENDASNTNAQNTGIVNRFFGGPFDVSLMQPLVSYMFKLFGLWMLRDDYKAIYEEKPLFVFAIYSLILIWFSITAVQDISNFLKLREENLQRHRPRQIFFRPNHAETNRNENTWDIRGFLSEHLSYDTVMTGLQFFSVLAAILFRFYKNDVEPQEDCQLETMSFNL